MTSDFFRKLGCHQSDFCFNDVNIEIFQTALGSVQYARNVDIVHPNLIPVPIGTRDGYEFDASNTVKTKLVLSCARTNSLDRVNLSKYINKSKWCTVLGETKFDEYIKQVEEHKFMFSPEGFGYDCFRTWEALYCGTYPIVKRRVFTEEFAKHLPILVIDAWDEVTEDFLNAKYIEFQNKEWNWDLLTEEYWINILN